MDWKIPNGISAQVISNFSLYWFSFTFFIFANVVPSKNLIIVTFFPLEREEKKKKKPDKILLSLVECQIVWARKKAFLANT